MRGRERKGGKSYFSKLLSTSSLPCDSFGGRDDWEAEENSDFPECRERSQNVWLPFYFLIRPCGLSTSFSSLTGPQIGLGADLQGPSWKNGRLGRLGHEGEGRRPLGESCCVIALLAAATRAGPLVLLRPRPDRRGGRRGETAVPVRASPHPRRVCPSWWSRRLKVDGHFRRSNRG